ncbi:MAG: F0F1 ATP synthase subunit epsilon [Synechococcus sp. BS301-5m-G54]|jgi:F-type H+-transporting ATPase subunit epsilon|uniref:ATP synthase F1 subunit epsilon n=1 Tax=Synechococcales TaxID=1890424 RepID=UPI0004E041ED|nr:ATP synthase F1 subunit epsilon [Synechococcus sp. KORDI-49]MBL6739411.1 F0F1 ATP synthase subunit epsilon [Synechococcus sp. BS301-5m-G54]MBL6796343.1 F0F1 ATP synthase subunit epsilon [Synechococcus sp. BS307-5m-G34]OUW67937.1 MAG: F0F1 ATP synthase subunit epsilon [Synechococcus sp. TMED205]HCX54823.1 F0F1 ATP synthase subunit epsilon [Synechococcus sp. UBA9887]AII46040.1 F0F1 ATP synthase subunit epsilon [Synechococcus sp. KORDI-49]|tara:strand:+ start:675 stop:1091 length:417 start_codon:yes stop_codon:yes gene_type:complete
MSGSLTLRVLATDQNVFDGSADEVILPSTTGQLGILPGHISLLTAIDVGVLRVRTNSGWSSIALMGGFAEVDADEVTVLVNGAELGSNIDGNSAEAEFQSASSAVAGMEGKPASPEKLKAQQQLNVARARMQASKVAG